MVYFPFTDNLFKGYPRCARDARLAAGLKMKDGGSDPVAGSLAHSVDLLAYDDGEWDGVLDGGEQTPARRASGWGVPESRRWGDCG